MVRIGPNRREPSLTVFRYGRNDLSLLLGLRLILRFRSRGCHNHAHARRFPHCPRGGRQPAIREVPSSLLGSNLGRKFVLYE